MPYFVWAHSEDYDRWARVDRLDPKIQSRNYRLTSGEPASSWYPADVVLDFAAEHGVELADSVPNTLSQLIVSERLAKLLETSGAAAELLPLKLRNHRGRLERDPYFLYNLLNIRSCVDRARSDFDNDELRPGRIFRFRHLVLNESTIDEPAQIFRLAERRSLILVREDLAQKITDAGMTGLVLQPTANHGAEFRAP